MPYPSAAQIDSLSTAWNIDDIILFAFAGQHARLPSRPSEVSQFVGEVEDARQRLFKPAELMVQRAQPVMLYAYMQDNGGKPPSAESLTNYLKSQGIINANNNIIRYPIPGEGYPPGSEGGTPPPEDGPELPAPAPSFSFNTIMSDATRWASRNPLAAGAIVVGLYWYMGGKLPILGKRGR